MTAGLGAGAIATALSVSAGVAAAGPGPDVVGQKYSDAQSALSAVGFSSVVSTTVGDRQAWPDCVVDSQVSRNIPPQENSGASATNQMLVSLNCDAAVASATSPGNSLESPQGRAAAAAAAAAKTTAAAKPTRSS
ncbi:hypothetical protein BH09ACT8_BH09ACT8_50590 [soil metagenome]